MSMFKKIKEDQLAARKSRDQLSTSLLTTLIGEAAMVGKNDGNRESTDSEVMSVIRKFIKNLDELISLYQPTSHAFIKAVSEKEILSTYLPKQLSIDDIKFHVNSLVHMGLSDMSSIMKHMKSNFDGRYDGKLLSQVVKQCLEK